ncbi:MAG TPA: hypothetical protein VMZ53_05205, partial [Kofleriaceae bacterium]|nr:hypothetical protein [Kofleriaceae bacterium]
VAPGFSGCSYDLMSAASTVDIGVAVTRGTNAFVIRGELLRDAALDCFRKPAGGTGPLATDDHGVVTVTYPDGRIRVVTFVDDHTLVMEDTKAPAKRDAKELARHLQEALQAGAPLAKNASYLAAMERMKKQAGVVAVSVPGSEAMAKSMQQMGVKVAFFTGWLDLTDRLQLQYAMELNSADDATQMANMMKGQLSSPSVKQMFDQIDTRAQDKTVTLDLSLNDAKLASLAGMMRGMLL